MMDTSLDQQNPYEGEISRGTTVYNVNGEKVGEVTLSTLRDGYFVVEKGWLFSHELFLPASAIARQDTMWIALNLSKEELKEERWNHPPGEKVASDSVQSFIEPGISGMGLSPTEGGVIHLPPTEDEPPLGNR